MGKIKQILKDSKGFTLLEVVVVIGIITISTMPIYKMMITGAKAQNLAEKNYAAVKHAEVLLESVERQIEKDLTSEYWQERGLVEGEQKEWLKDESIIEKGFISDFLNLKTEYEIQDFHNKFKTNNFSYELYIWPLVDGEIQEDPHSYIQAGDSKGLESVSIDLEIQDYIKEYFSYKSTLGWISFNLGSDNKIKALAELTSNLDKLTFKGRGLSSNLNVDASENLEPRVNIEFKDLDSTWELIISESKENIISVGDKIFLAIDLDKLEFLEAFDLVRVVRVENQTKASVILPIFNENERSDGTLQVYPLQNNKDGNIIVETRKKQEPAKNFAIGILVRDACKSTSPKANKILTKLVNIYSYDYRKR